MTQIISVVIDRNTTPLTEPGFSITQIFSNDASLDGDFIKGTSRSYTTLAGVAEDFDTDSATYKKAQILFSQTNPPDSLRIFLRSDAVAEVKTIEFDDAIQVGGVINGKVNGVAITETDYDTDSDTTLGLVADKIADLEGIQSAEVDGNNIVVTAVIEWNLSLTDWTSTGDDAPGVTIDDTTDGVNLSDDITSSIAEKKDWYFAMATTSSKAAILAAAGVIQANVKQGCFVTSDAECLDDEADHVIKQVKDLSYSRTSVWYQEDSTEHLDAALLGECLAYKPGKIRFGLRKLTGVSASDLTATQKDNILAEYGNVYTEVLGINITEKGRTGSGDYIDVMRDIDYLTSQIQLRLFALVVNDKKIGFTDQGAQKPVGELKATLFDAEKSGIIKDDYTVSYPKVLDVSTNNRANRIYPDLNFIANLQGSIEAIQINGVVKV